MPRLLCLVLLPTLLMTGGRTLDAGARGKRSSDAGSTDGKTLDGGTAESLPHLAAPDAGAPAALPVSSGFDAGSSAASPISLRFDGGTADAGCVRPPGSPAESICWPNEVQPLAKLDGPAVVAANAALQALLARFSAEETKTCEYSPRAMELVVGQAEGLYFVRINHRVDKCGWAAPGFNLETDWFELYAVSPDGRVLERYPYYP